MTWIGLLLVTAAVSASAPADTAPRPISLAEAVAMAQENAPVVIQAQGQRRTSAAAVRSAYAAFIPSLSLTAGATRRVPTGAGQTVYQGGQQITLVPTPWSYNTGLGASVDLFVGGQRFFALRQARSQVGVADANLVTQRYGAVLAAKQQFFNVLAAIESEAAAQAQLQQAQQQLHTSVLQLKARTVTRSDSLRSEIAVHNAQLALLTARTARDQADAALTRAVGAPSPVTAAADDSLDRGGLALSDEDLRALALEGPGVRQATASLEAARAALRGTWATYLPSVTASYNRRGSAAGSTFSLANDYGYTGSVSLALSFPIFDQLQRSSQVVQAQVERDNATASLRDARLGALESLAQALGAYHTAEQQVTIQTNTLAAAEEDLREQNLQYSVGTSTLLNVLTSEATLDQARHDLIQARYNQRVAKAQLEALVGRSL